MAAINPYLNFGGNCEAAFTFYKSVFGGELTTLMRFKDAPPEGNPSPDEGEQIMHVALPIGHGTTLMGSDRPAAMGPVTNGNNAHMSIQTDNEEEATRVFNGLAAGGQVVMPLQQTFWGATFGMLTDKFGVQWMVNNDNS
jgi:PhnB protein